MSGLLDIFKSDVGSIHDYMYYREEYYKLALDEACEPKKIYNYKLICDKYDKYIELNNIKSEEYVENIMMEINTSAQFIKSYIMLELDYLNGYIDDKYYNSQLDTNIDIIKAKRYLYILAPYHDDKKYTLFFYLLDNAFPNMKYRP